MGVFDKTVVFALNKKSPPSAAILFSFANLRLPGTFTGGLREVKTSRNLPGKLPGKLTGSKITGVSRNTRKVYGSLTGDLPGPIIYRVFRETGPWCLRIVSQGAKATYMRTQSTQYNFASLHIVEGSTGAVVAASQIKAVELDFFSTSNCFSSCFLHAPVSDPFTVQSIQQYRNNMDPLSETDVIQTESPENFVVIFEILPIDKE